MFLSELFCGSVWLVLTEIINILRDYKDGESSFCRWEEDRTPRVSLFYWDWLVLSDLEGDPEDVEIYTLVYREFKAHTKSSF